VDVQFNWIFILIAGFVIFLFIISVVFSQKRNAEVKEDISTINQITTLLKSKQQIANVYSEMTIPNTNMNFKCDADTRYFSYKISNSERVTLPNEIIFGPQDISARKIQIWSQAFDTGFPVSVFTYITTQNSVIIIYNTSGCPYAKQLYDSLPDNITKKITSDLSMYGSNKNKKIVCFNGYGCPPANVDYINIAPAGGLFGYGNVTFHRKGNINTVKPYLMGAGLYGAIFSDTAEYYGCQMSRALDQFELKRSLVAKRLEMMRKDLEPSDCSLDFEVILNEEIIPMSNPSFNFDSIALLYDKADDLYDRNVDLTLSSCPKIY